MSATAGTRDGKIDISEVLSRMLDTYKKTAPVLIISAVLVFLPVALLTALLADSAAGIIAALVSIVASVWYSGMVVRAVQDVQDGRLDSSIGELFKSVTPVLGQLVVVGIIAGIGIAIGLILLIIPGLILLTIWSVAAPVVVVEKPGAVAALGRSRKLVGGNVLQVFGVIVAIFLLLIIVSIVVGSIGAIADSFVLAFISNLVLNVALAPVYALAAAVLYFTLREEHGDAAALPGAAAGGTDAFGRSAPTAPEAPSAWRAPSAPDQPAPGDPSRPPSTPPPGA